QPAAEDVYVEEVPEKLGEKRGAISGDRRLDSFEIARVDPAWVVGRLQKERCNGGHEHRLAHAVRSVLSEVAGDLAASHREADQGEIVKVELRHELVQVLGERVVVISDRRLARLAKPSAVVRDDSMTCAQEVRD